MKHAKQSFRRVDTTDGGPLVRYDHFMFRYEPGKEYSLTILIRDTDFGIDVYTASVLEHVTIACNTDTPPRPCFWAINELAHDHEVYAGTSRNMFAVHPPGSILRIRRLSGHKKIRLHGTRYARTVRVWASDASEFARACIKIISPSRITASYSRGIRAKRVSIQTRPKKEFSNDVLALSAGSK